MSEVQEPENGGDEEEVAEATNGDEGTGEEEAGEDAAGEAEPA